MRNDRRRGSSVAGAGRRARAAGRAWAVARFEAIEPRLLLSGAFDAVGLTALRADPAFAGVDGSDVGIAILDSGVFSQHPDLRDNFVGWYDAVTRTSSGAPIDPNGHGTHVAGTAGSSNPAIGVATAARLIGVRALPSGNERPRHDTVAEALRWVVDNQARFNIRVVNMSLGVPSHNFNAVPVDASSQATLIRRLEQLGVTVVTASGNSYADFAAAGASTPAVFSSLSVASTWEDNGAGDTFPLFAGGGGPFAAFEREGRRDRLAGSSQRSTLPNQVAAPGQTILSTWNGSNGQMYNTIYGTSMASPLVAGMVALLQDAAQTFGGRYLSVSEVVSVVRGTADVIVDGTVSSNGRVQIATRQSFDLPETGESFLRVNINSAVRRVRMMLTGTEGPMPVTGDANNTIMKAVGLGSINGSRTLTATGAIGADGQFSAGTADVDVYRFEVLSAGSVEVRLSRVEGGTAFDPYLRLFDAGGTQIAFNDDDGEDLYPRIVSGQLAPGTYHVGVSGFGNEAYSIVSGAGGVGGSTGDYAVSIALDNPDPDGVMSGATEPAKLPMVALDGSIGFDGDRFIGTGDVDFYLVTAPDTGTLVFDVDTDDLAGGADTVLRVFNEEMAEVASNDDREFGDIDPRILLPVVRGQRYWVAVSDFRNDSYDPTQPFGRSAAGEGGEYQLVVLLLNGDENGTVFGAVTLEPGSTLNGVIGTDFGGPTIGADGTKDVDFLVFTPGAGGVLDLGISSPDGTLRPVIALWRYDADADDVVVVGRSAGAETGDFGAVLRAFVVAGEEYYVSITGFGNDDFDWFAPATGLGGDTGNYVLTTALRGNAFARTLIDNSVNNGTPGPILLGEPLSGEIGADGAFALDAADLDVYRFVATATQVVVIRTFTTAENATDTVLRVFDAAGNELRVNDDISAENRASRVQLTVQAGQTYYIGVNGYSPDAFTYNPLTGAGAAAGVLGTYVLSVAAAAAPEIEVLGADGTAIVSGDSTPSEAEGTRFGQAAVLGVGGGAVEREFTIFNFGSRPLRLTGSARVTVTGAAAGDFTVVSQPRATIAKNTSATFRVRFSPTAAGARRATIMIESNDADESSYTFAVLGTGVNRPEIDVQGFRPGSGKGRSILSGDTTPDIADGTRFGSAALGAGVVREFVVRNIGRKALRMTGSPRVTLSGEGASDFAVVQQPGLSVGAGKTGRFVLRFSPTAVGQRVAYVTILNNDADEGAYTFTISGTGIG
ncbi:MAG: DVUA0089 family protein [Phycisphaerales bacterium]